jgi:hypothetical protein
MPRSLTREWLRYMRAGDFEAAWRISDAVLHARGGKSCRYSPIGQEALWDGQPLDGKRVLVRCCHGLGDTVQFVRYVPLIRQITRRVIVQTQARLIPLLENVTGIDAFATLYNKVPAHNYDAAVEIMELPQAFRTSLSEIPAMVPYIQVQSRHLPTSGNLAVGIVWRSGEWDKRRSIPFELIARLDRVPGITLHVLQRGRGLQERPLNFGVDSGSDDIGEAARVIAGLDLVISVDSMPAHLAGALGAPTWTLLHAHCDWRWMTARSDSPWYPTMRLFRQSRAGDWRSVIDEVKAELEQFAREFHRSAETPRQALLAA